MRSRARAGPGLIAEDLPEVMPAVFGISTTSSASITEGVERRCPERFPSIRRPWAVAMGFPDEGRGMFRVGEKTSFAGQFDTQAKIIADASCVIEIDGEPSGRLRIEGEVHTGKAPSRSWTTSPVSLTANPSLIMRFGLISEQA